MDAPSPAAVAIVPLKALGAAKGRLDPVLDPVQRRDLAAWMALRVLAAVRAAPAIIDVLLVAGDADAEVVGRDAGATVVRPDAPGLNHAIATADHHVTAGTATLVLAADLPLATPEDVAAVLDAASGRGVVVAATDDGGTGALLRRPGGVIAPAYGPGSASAHLRAATAAGVHGERLRIDNLASDIDTPAALAELATRVELPRALADAARAIAHSG